MKKVNFIKMALFISVSLLIIFSVKVISYIQEYGLEILEKKSYIETEYFERLILNEIDRIETAFHWSIWNDNHLEWQNGMENIYQTGKNIEFIAEIKMVSGEEYLFSNLPVIIKDKTQRIEEFKKGYLYYICSLNEESNTNMEFLKKYGFKADQSKFEILNMYIRVNFENESHIKWNKQGYEDAIAKINLYIVGAVILLIISIILLIKVIKIDEDNNNLSIKILLMLVMILLSIQTRVGIGKIIIYLITYTVLLEILFLIIRIIKEAKREKEKIIIKIIKKIKESYKALILIFIITFVAIEIMLGFIHNYDIVIYNSNVVILGKLIYIALMIDFIKIYSEYSKIEKYVKNIAKGIQQEKLETKNKLFKNLVENVNNIKGGIEKAVSEKVKSERLKTDLITNVSHDLKTPLTSIINYTNLLKKENIQNENANKYIEILENKSKKLKNLTEDLIEVSKISSGNETVNLEKLNFAEMVLQANGEFAEKFESKYLKIVAKIEKEEILVDLDSKKMWRVLENIYNNVYKYSLENTRVYVNLEQGEKIIFTIKNISKSELNITPDELMERFVRGDKSRTTSGNGLRTFNSKRLSSITRRRIKNFNRRRFIYSKNRDLTIYHKKMHCI